MEGAEGTPPGHTRELFQVAQPGGIICRIKNNGINQIFHRKHGHSIRCILWRRQFQRLQ